MVHAFLVSLFGPTFYTGIVDFLYFYPLWLPIILGIIFFELWLDYVRTYFIIKQGHMLLEFKLPREINKSPKAMELFLTSLFQTGAASYRETYWDGKVRPWFSLELVSIEGQVHFYIWTPPKFKNLIEAQIYAQYPEVEVYEVPDYTSWFKRDPEKYTFWGTQYKLSGKDPLPIKTYIDYGLDKDPKEEFKVDPLTSVLEFLGSMKQGEHVWIQILIQAHKAEGIKEGRLFKREDWKGDIKKEIEKVIKEAKGKPAEDDEEGASFTSLTPGQRDLLSSIERNSSKQPFECMMRAFYIAKKEVFNSIGITGVIGSVRQYNATGSNGFKLGKFTDHEDNGKDFLATFGWIPFVTDFMDRRRSGYENGMLDAYKQRGFFQNPYKNYRGKPFILTTEELATIYHFPGQVAATPTLSRVPSKKAQPPANLPI
jgi:hypothetical protein